MGPDNDGILLDSAQSILHEHHNHHQAESSLFNEPIDCAASAATTIDHPNINSHKLTNIHNNNNNLHSSFSSSTSTLIANGKSNIVDSHPATQYSSTMGPDNDGILLDSAQSILHEHHNHHQAESSLFNEPIDCAASAATTIDHPNINSHKLTNIHNNNNLHSSFSSSTSTLIANGKSNIVDSHPATQYSKLLALDAAATLSVNGGPTSTCTTNNSGLVAKSDCNKMTIEQSVSHRNGVEYEPHQANGGDRLNNLYRSGPDNRCETITATLSATSSANNSSSVLCQRQMTPNGCHQSDTIFSNTNSNIIANNSDANSCIDLGRHQPDLHRPHVNSIRYSSTQSVSLRDHCRCDQPEPQPSMDLNNTELNNDSIAINPSIGNGYSDHSTTSVVNGNINGLTSNARPQCSNGTHPNGTNGKSHAKNLRPTTFIDQEEPPYHIELMCYFNFVVLMLFGYIRDFMCKIGLEKNMAAIEKNRDGYPQIYKSFESFYTRNIYRRIRDAWNCPIASVPGAYIDVINRVSHDYNWTFEHSNTTTRIVNMGSYNYLGFAENSGPIHSKILEIIKTNSVGVCSTSYELGTSRDVRQLEEKMANFLGTEACAVFGMGFATNSTNIQCFAQKGCLVMSDELNHASLILGCKLSGATVRVFRHNDIKDLDRKIRRYLIEGQPKTGEPWKKVIILVEGIYSMEGTIVDLPGLIEVKNRYKCYIYLDEAHSIGALGPNGRGVVDYYNCDPYDIDILMGTFSKSFDASGGYIAGRKEVIDYIRYSSYSGAYGNSMSPIIANQINCVVQSLTQEEGIRRIRQLARNTKYFRKRLSQMGFIVFGNEDSPVVPVLICFCSKIAAVIRAAFKKGLGFIGAGFPATRLTSGRVRFCVSAAHTLDILDRSLEVMDEIGYDVGIKYSRKPQDCSPIEY